jgi:hypothetical protein
MHFFALHNRPARIIYPESISQRPPKHRFYTLYLRASALRASGEDPRVLHLLSA